MKAVISHPPPATAMSEVSRADVEALLETLEQVHKPNRGLIAELCRTWLAVQDAPVVDVFKYRGCVVIEPDDESLVGKRVRLLAEDTANNHNNEESGHGRETGEGLGGDAKRHKNG